MQAGLVRESVHKDKTGDDFECPHTLYLTKYIAENFCVKRKEYAEQEAMGFAKKCDSMEAPVKIKL